MNASSVVLRIIATVRFVPSSVFCPSDAFLLGSGTGFHPGCFFGFRQSRAKCPVFPQLKQVPLASFFCVASSSMGFVCVFFVVFCGFPLCWTSLRVFAGYLGGPPPSFLC